jgi:hypothetical protein
MTLNIGLRINREIALLADRYISVEGISMSSVYEQAPLDLFTIPMLDRTLDMIDSPSAITIAGEMRKITFPDRWTAMQFAGDTRVFPEYVRAFKSAKENGDFDHAIETVRNEFNRVVEDGSFSCLITSIDEDWCWKEALHSARKQLTCSVEDDRFLAFGSGIDGISVKDYEKYFRQVCKSIPTAKEAATALSALLLNHEIRSPATHQKMGFGGGYDIAYLGENGFTWTEDTVYIFLTIYVVEGYGIASFHPAAYFQQSKNEYSTTFATNLLIVSGSEFVSARGFNGVHDDSSSALIKTIDILSRTGQPSNSFMATDYKRQVLVADIIETNLQDFRSHIEGHATLQTSMPCSIAFNHSREFGDFSSHEELYCARTQTLKLTGLKFEPNRQKIAEHIGLSKLYLWNNLPAEIEDLKTKFATTRSVPSIA